MKTGKFELPQLPSTLQKVTSLTANAGVEMDAIVNVISTDPVLSSELLKTANSVLYGGRVACEGLRDAVMRLGMRGLRGIVMTFTMRTAILRDPRLTTHAKEVWRQALSVARLARHLAPHARIDPDHAYLMGLTHDIGKVALLAMVSRHTRESGKLSGAFLGTLFVRFHERIGAKMASEWNLPEEIVSIAGRHHDFARNPTHPREAALVSLAHRMDLFATQGEEQGYRLLSRSDEMDLLEIPREDRMNILSEALPLLRETEAMATAA